MQHPGMKQYYINTVSRQNLAIFCNQGVASVWTAIPIYNGSFFPNIFNMVSIPNIFSFSNNQFIWKKSIIVKFLFFIPLNMFISDWLRSRRRTPKWLITPVDTWIQNFSWYWQLIWNWCIEVFYQTNLPGTISLLFVCAYLHNILTVLTTLSTGFKEWWYELEYVRTMSKLEKKSWKLLDKMIEPTITPYFVGDAKFDREFFSNFTFLHSCLISPFIPGQMTKYLALSIVLLVPKWVTWRLFKVFCLILSGTKILLVPFKTNPLIIDNSHQNEYNCLILSGHFSWLSGQPCIMCLIKICIVLSLCVSSCILMSFYSQISVSTPWMEMFKPLISVLLPGSVEWLDCLKKCIRQFHSGSGLIMLYHIILWNLK